MTPDLPHSDAGREAIEAILERPQDTLLGVDFDGTLAPIIDDPEQAFADRESVAALGRIGHHINTVAVVTGRPAKTAVRLGRFAESDDLGRMVVLGQYGVERWDAQTGEFRIPPSPDGVAAVETALPGLLARHGVKGARVEHKGRAIGVHTRELDDPAGAMGELTEPIGELAEQNGLKVEPGKNVLEMRPPGMDKGDALRSLVIETGSKQVIFAGDDLGDLPAFEAVEKLRAEGVPGLLICSASREQDALAERADLVLDGPHGVAIWLTQLADSLDHQDRK